MRIKEVYEFIEKNYPGLVYIDNDRLYMADRSISTECLIYKNSGATFIELHGVNFDMTLAQMKGINRASFVMGYDFKLSLDSCMGLYKNNIVIWYFQHQDLNNKTYRTQVKYDRNIIERQWTIKNIINE